MNIFVVDECPTLAAKQLCDKHVVKMVLETAQLLSTTLLMYDIEAPYKLAHKNHPCSIWARESEGNFLWLVEHGLSLAAEYTERYDKIHKSQSAIEYCFENAPSFEKFSKQHLKTPHVLCMPDEYKTNSVVESYRNYYRGSKAEMATWKQNKPVWF